MMSKNIKSYKFRGGVDIGVSGGTWPFGILEVNQDKLILHDGLLKKEEVFTKDGIERIEIKKIFCIKHAIRIYSKDQKQNDNYVFYYFPHRFSRLLDALKKCNYL